MPSAFTTSHFPSKLLPVLASFLPPQEIQVIVYPENYVDKEKFTQGQPAKASADAKDRTVRIDFSTLPDVEYTKGTGYIVKGTLSSFSISSYDPGGTLYMKKAVLVGEAKDAKPAKFNLASINATDVYNMQDIVSSVAAWDGKMITVNGDYNGTTVSC